ncbi:MAG: hypothetical protein Q8O56_03490 [Solirubrobacteraceae bacterium]|nr:hypothetical protein [Solirubrobacteraceae bacterium]
MRQSLAILAAAAVIFGLGGSAATAIPPAGEQAQAGSAASSSSSKRPLRARGVYRTPGYSGIRRVPRTGPAPPPPSVALSANGWKPDVLVDPAGTAHVVWVEDYDASGANNVNDLLRYCRLPRGASTCTNPSTTPFEPSLTPTEDYAGPRILQIGDGLVVLTTRFPEVRQHPDGATSATTLYAYTSTDGGTTWSAPAIVGNQAASGNALVWGGAAPRISVISDTQTAGTVVQTVTPGAYTRGGALLGPGDEAYSGRLALDGELPVAAFSDLAGNGIVRKLVPGGDPQSPASWTRAVIPDAEVVRIAGGPAGVVLMSRPRAGGPYLARRVADGVPGAATPLPLPPNRTGSIADLDQDPAGGLDAVYRDSIGSSLWRSRSQDGGRTWGSAQLLALAATSGGGIDGPRVAAAADGGGVAVYRRDSTRLTSGTIGLSAFGTLAPTGLPGIGGLAGGGTPGAIAGCDRASVGALRAVPLQGCFLPSVDPQYPGAVVSQGDVDLNGLIVRPDPGVRIVLDPRRKRIDTTGKVRVILRGAGIELTLLHDKLSMQLPAVGAGATLFDFQPGRINLAGFPIAGRIQVQLTATGVRIPLSLALPGAFGGISGSATVLADSGRGVRLDSLQLKLARAPLGPLEVRDLLISYTGSTETWRGKATLGLPPQPGGASLGADVTFVRGRFQMGSFALRPPFPGIALGPNVYFTELRGGFGLDPIRIGVGASFGAFPIAPPRTYTVGVDGDATLTVAGGTVQLGFTGRGNLAGLQIAETVIRATTEGYADLTANFAIDLEIVAIDGSLQAFLDGPRKQFGATASTRVRVAGAPLVGQRAAISNKGIGVCYTFLGAGVYAGYAFGQPIPRGVSTGVGCNLSAYTIERPGPAGARAAQAGGPTFTVSAGTTIQNVELTSAAGTPAVSLLAPDGTVVTPVDAVAAGTLAGPASSLFYPAASRTVVVLRNPRPGRWTVVPDAGSAPISGLRVSRELPEVRVTASVARRGARRALVYRIGSRNGATVRFAERGPRGAVRALGVASGTAGSIVFSPAAGPAGRREIVAFVERGDLPQSARVVARYVAPVPRRPAIVRGVRARRTGSIVTVRWVGVPAAAGYVVRVRGQRSRRVIARITGPSTRILRITGVSADDGRLLVTVAARDRQGRAGRAGVGRG